MKKDKKKKKDQDNKKSHGPGLADGSSAGSDPVKLALNAIERMRSELAGVERLLKAARSQPAAEEAATVAASPGSDPAATDRKPGKKKKSQKK